MENREIARLLAGTADLMEIAGEDSFRIRSYRNAAASIENHPERIEDILQDPSRSVTAIPGIGKGLAAVLQEIAARGSFERRDQLLEQYPPTALEFLKIQGLGPKSIALIWEHFRVSTIDDLERLCLDHQLRELPRMGAKLEEKVLRSIAVYRRSAGRFLLSFAEEAANRAVTRLSSVQGVERIAVAGSLRRGKETVGNVDLVLSGPRAAEAAAGLGADEGIPVKPHVAPTESFGAALQHFTGSKEHNLALLARASAAGVKLGEQGLFRDEEGAYEALGLAWIPPELRENQGEIEAAAEGRLPHLVELAQIRGDLHMHTVESDGHASLEDMAEAAKRLGYEYIAITDHSKALAMANGLDEKRVIAFAERVRRINRDGLGIRIFSGIECDILKDGSMDLAGEALAALDFVTGSVHSYMNMESAAMTDRLLRALECPHLRMLGHPTGRLLLRRDAFPFDFERVAAEAGRRGVCFEINSSPERLDLSPPLLRAAKDRGVKFIISTDAHHPAHLANMRYGVTTARRGWLESADVINTLPLGRFDAFLRRDDMIG
jgi:DNA polymerase (family 10)